MREVQTGPALGFVAQLALLTALAGTVGVGGPGWFVGLACGLFTNGLLARGLARSGSARLGRLTRSPSPVPPSPAASRP